MVFATRFRVCLASQIFNFYSIVFRVHASLTAKQCSFSNIYIYIYIFEKHINLFLKLLDNA